MAIPNKEIFESFEQDFNWIIKDSWLELLVLPNKPIARNDIKDLLEDWYLQFDKLSEQYNKHQLVILLEANPSWSVAMNSLYGKKNKKNITNITKEQWIENKINELMRVEETEGEYNNVIRKRVSYFLRRDLLERNKMLFRAFYNYFHTDKWLKVVDEIADVERVLSKALLSVAPLKEIETLNDFISFPNNVVERFEDTINRALSEHRAYFYPIIRKDNTVKERGLVWDLALVFRRYFGSDKPMVIYHLLMLEGIENNLELRTIERLLSKWKADRTARYEAKKLERIGRQLTMIK